jgi:predicted transcriptional regulator
MKKRNGERNETDPVILELDAIKRLLVLLLIKAGTRQGEIAMALGVAQSAVSNMFPSRKVKRFQEEEQD